jgi:hypothetical protein
MLISNFQHRLLPGSGSSGLGNKLPLQAHLALEETAASLSGGECYAGYRQK